MPEFTLKEVRLPELHLPEINRDEIVRALAGVHLPDVDLAKARRATLKVPAMTLSATDVDRLIAAGTALTRFAKPAPSRARAPWKALGRNSRSPMALIARPKRRRWRRPLMLGVLVVVALAVVSFLRRPATQDRIESATRDAKERFATWRAQDLRPEDAPLTDATPTSMGVDGIANATEDGSPVADTSPDAVMARSGDTDGVPAFEESQTSG
jgi:hypothetical protein